MNNEDALSIPYGRHTITSDDISAVQKVLTSQFLTQGPTVPAFEQALAKRVDANYAVAVNSATSALHIACLALGLGPGDKLWTTPISFVASANCGRYCGADIDFVDIETSSGLMSISALTLKLQKAELTGTLPKILVPVHLTGSSCDMASIRALANRYGFKVLEDASHAIGGTYQGMPVGSCKFSDITVFSFHPVKIITTGEGGAATTNDIKLACIMQQLRSHGIVRDSEDFEYPPTGPWFYEQQRLGFNYRLTDLQAALGLSQLQRLDTITAERNKQRVFYNELVSSLPVRLLHIPTDVYSSVHLAVIQLIQSTPDLHRRVFEGLRSKNIFVQLHYIPIHLHPYYQRLGFAEGHYPCSEQYAFSSISLPLFPGLSQCQQEFVVNSISDLLLQ